MILYDYQNRLFELYRAAQDPRPLLVLPPGGGKTLVGLSCVRDEQFIWAAHRRELLDQAEKAAFRLGMPPILTVTVQGLLTMPVKPRGRLVFDECVTGDTIVGGKPAREVTVGDLVESWNGSKIVRRQVTHVFRNTAATLRTLYVGNVWLTITDAHPIWIEGKGYVEGGDVRVGDLCRVQAADGDRRQRQVPKDVLNVLSTKGLVPYDVEHQSSSCVGPDETEQSDGRSKSPKTNAENSSQDWPYAENAGRKRDRPYRTSEAIVRGSWIGLDSGVCIVDRSRLQEARLTHALQDRSCEVESPLGNRDRRWQSCGTSEMGAGCQEGSILDLARVDRIEVHERGSDGTFGGRCPDSIVYNFEVAGEHNFLANGILTHNCHHGIADEWSKLLEFYPHMLGLTATPENAKGIGLGSVFTSIHVGASFKELIGLGRLVPIEVIAPSKLLKAGQIAQHPVKAYQQHCLGEKAILFAPNVAAAMQYAVDFKAAGIPAAYVHGEMPRKERDRVIADYCAGRYRVLTNALLLTEGFDDPGTSVVIVARGCSTPGTWIQTTMRCGRAHPSKSRGLVLDLRGVSHVHGDPCEDRIYSLEGRGIRRKAELVDARYCQVCGALWTGLTCEECGNVIEPPTPPRVVNAKLEKRVYLPRASEEDKINRLAGLIAEGAKKGYKANWPAVRFQILYGTWPNTAQKQAAYAKLRTK